MADSSPSTELGNESLAKLPAEGDADQDTCRICSAPAEPDQPLFHPCKCSGTIRYIHQDCLTTWLSHSKKKTCDVCKHPYSFTKVYADDMPSHLPAILLLRKLAQQALFAGFFCIRAIIVSFVWLAILPWVTVWTWRLYFTMGNSTARWISARPMSSSSSPASFFFYNLTSRSQSNSTATNATLRQPSNDTESSTLDGLLTHPLLRSISADIFTGQIIATLIVLVFIAVFLLREWISQNARPGVFEEGDPALAAEPEAEQERERQQRVREQARAMIELRRRQQAEAERLPRAREGDPHPHQLESTRHHADQPIKDLPTRPPSRRAHELRATYKATQPDQVGLSSSDAAGPSSVVSPTFADVPNPSYVQARQEWLRAAEKRRLSPLESTSSLGEQRESSSLHSNAGSSAQAKSVDNAVIGSRKGKAKAVDIEEESNNQGPASISMVSHTANVLAALRQKRITWGIPDAESWTLYDFERFEMTRLGIDLMFSPHGIVVEKDPWQLIIQAGVYPVVQDGTTSFTSAELGTHNIAAPDDWTEWLGDAVDDASRWRARRRVLWERLREEAERDGLDALHLPSELSGIPIEELHMVQDINCVWTPPPAPKLNSRLPVLAGLSPTPSPSGATDDQTSLLTAHKQLRAEGSRMGRSFTISTVSIAPPDEDDGRSRHIRPRTHSQADPKAFAFPSPGGDDQLFPCVTQKPLPFPIGPTASLSHEPPSQFAVSTPPSQQRGLSSSSLPSSPTVHPLDSPLPPTPAISMPRRPPMPNTTIPTPASAPPSLLPRSSRDSTPLESPSLATYQPPEEFQEGSPQQGYFDGVEDGEGELGHPRNMNHERFEEDAAVFFKGEPTFAYEAGKESRLNTEEEEDEEDDEGDLPGLLADSDEDGDEDARELRGAMRGAARRAQRRAAWGPEWNDAVPAEVADGGDVAVEADDDGEDVEGEEVDDAALAAQLADEDLAVEDDMEGALEAIGMRGPLYVVAQNAALMIFVLDTAVGVGVWVPFTFGKSTALLSLDPRRALQVLHWPIRVIRIVTDPVVDSIFIAISYLIIPSIVRLFDEFFTAVVWALSTVVPRDDLEKSVHFVHTTRENFMNFPWDRTSSYIASLTSKLAAGPRPNTTPSLATHVLGLMDPIVVRVEPYFEVLCKQIRASSCQVSTGWTRMALGDGTGERVFAIALGYAVIGLLIAFYLNVFTVGSVRSAGRAVRSAVRQQLLVVKVATFIIIELVLFPLGCGINLDLCSIWLFPEASLQSRIAFFQYAPLTATFYHWVVGTMFMYQFAILLAGCRTIMRPGAMWFIKDPSDQNFHPIRDILERPALVQLRKLSVSAVMYGLVVACGVGSVGGLMRLGRGLVLPLRWKPREPLSDVPIDLLFLHILLPYTLRFFRPRRVIRKTAIMVWKYLCARLCLTSYMFGGRHPEEEREDPCTGWLRFGKSDDKATDSELPLHGSYRRVPNSDNVAVPRDMRATARVDVDGIPVDDEARTLIAAQDAEAEKAKRNPKDDYTVVYIPPHFQYRIGLFIFALWVIGCVFITAAVSVPILLGRGVFNLFTERQMHDGYSFLVGFYALWGCWVVGHAIERMDKRRQRRSADDARGNWPLYFLKRSVLWLAKISYIVSFVGVVIPALLGLVVELYIIMPIRLSLNPGLLPKVRVVDMWALGIIYAKIVLHANRFRPLNRITAGFNHIKAHGWTNPEPFSATAEVIAPLIVGLVGMLALPPAILVLLHRVAPLQLDQRFILMHVYPGIFAGAGLIRLGVTGSKALSRSSQSIRDTEFLVEMRLRNYEQEKEREKKEKEKRKGRSDTEDATGTEEAVMPVAD